MKEVNVLVSHLSSLQNNTMFDCFYLNALQESRSLTGEELPRNRKSPHRLDPGSSEPHRHSDPKEMYHQIYYETIDVVAEEVKLQKR